MKYLLILFAALPLWSITTASGQGFQAGISAGYLIHAQPENDAPGTGVEGGAWASWPITRQSRLRVYLGHRRMGGFNRLSLDTQEISTTTETRRTVSAIQLTALHFVDAEIGWAFQPAPESPWKYYAGLYYAHLAHWQDFDRTATAIDESGRKWGEGADPNWPFRDELRGNDFGLHLGVSYRLLKGMAIQLRVRKGFPDLVPGSRFTDSPKDHLGALSIGLSTRLF